MISSESNIVSQCRVVKVHCLILFLLRNFSDACRCTVDWLQEVS